MLELKAGPVAETIFLVPLSVSKAGQDPPQAQNISTRQCDAVRVGNVVVAFNRRDGSMGVFMPWEENYVTDAKILIARLEGGKRQVITVK